jgi:ABC-type protease/lipase transport system fused ATPase/permease subunit
MAGMHETLQSLHAGYDTEVGPSGSYLSFRERRAVALSRAVAGNPKIIVLDEPEIGLDGASMRRLIRDLHALKAQGVVLVIATQDPRLMALVDKVAVLSSGALQTFADARDVKQAKPHIVAQADGSDQPATVRAAL